MMCDYAFLSKDPSWSWWGLPIFTGMSWHLPYSGAIPCHPSDSIIALLPHSLTGIGRPWKICSDVAFLLIFPKEGIAKERVYGLAMVWVHPYQARVSTIDDVARRLILLASPGPNWPYVFVQSNGDAHCMPLPKEGALECDDIGGT